MIVFLRDISSLKIGARSQILIESRRDFSVATFPDETMLLLHEDVLGADEPGHVAVLDVVVRCGLRVGTLKEENNVIVKV